MHETPASRIRKYIEERGIKQAFISQKTGISQNILSSRLRETTKFSVDEIEKICGVLNENPNTFLKPKQPEA